MYCQKIICVEAPEMNFAAPSGEETQMAQSIGKFLHEIKGFGFIEQKNSDKAIVHFSASSAIGFKSLIEGNRVTFGTTKGPKKLQAANVNKI